MTLEQIKEKVLQYRWELWADRPFGAFILSLFGGNGFGGNGRMLMRKVGVNTEWPAHLFQAGAWYRSDEVWDTSARELEMYVRKGGSIFKVVKNCENYHEPAKESIQKLIVSRKTPAEKLAGVYETILPIMSYVWLAHGFEHLYLKKLHAEVLKFMEGDVEKNIGDISYPKKKNAHVYFEEALRSDEPLSEVERRFAWVKVRDGFSDGFSIEELTAERERLQKSPEKHGFVRPPIPVELRELSEIAQELVYYRTLRTDILYELLYLSRPILCDVAAYHGLQFKELRDYSVHDLISGKLEKYEYGNVSAIAYGDNYALLHGKVFEDKLTSSAKEVRGAIAYKGKVQGRAKIVMVAHEIGKVEEGDILFAPTTAPSYIIGMQKAAAFVTDEGGITSHAAIVSREMRKPCIIGTKLGTRTFKDGDSVEVDAERGVVSLL